MNTNAKKGDKVFVTLETLNNGSDSVKEHARKHLVDGGIYTVHDTIISAVDTIVYLDEFPHHMFNSVSFLDYPNAPYIINIEVLNRAIERYGKVAQMGMIQEEALELALSIRRYQRGDMHPEEAMKLIYDELADMKIMLAQAELMFNSKRIDERVAFKMNRLKKRLNK